MQEAVTFGLKQMALHIDDDEHLLDASERMFLKEETYELRESGEVVPRALFIPMLRNIRFAFSTFANAQGLAFRLPVSDSHWLKLRTAIAVRNRLTHPKQPLDVQVSEDEYQTVRDANIWLVLQAYELLRAAADKDRERVTLLDQQLASIREERAEIARELRALLVKRAARKRTRFSDKKRPPAP